MIPHNIEKEHIAKAIEEIDRDGIRKGRHSSTYDLIYNGKSYPPKLIISIANKYANGTELDPKDFGGGKDTEAFKLLESNGFTIKEKSTILTIDEIKKGVQLLCETSSEVEGYYQNDENIVIALNKANKDDLKRCQEYYASRTGVVIDIRKELIERLIKDEIFTVDRLHELIEKYKKGKETQFRSYKETFSIVFPAITFYGHNEQRKFVDSFAQQLINNLGINEQVKEVSFDFQGVRQQGSDRYWVAIYNKEQENQSKGIQFFFEFYQGKIGYGVYRHSNQTYVKPRKTLSPKEFNYEEMLNYFEASKELLLEDVPNANGLSAIPINAKVIYAYLKNSLSHRKIQKEVLGKEAPAKGGGFLAMEILHSYEIEGDKKGILNNTEFNLEYNNADGKYLEALELLKEYYPEFAKRKTNINDMNLSLNTILYGPPGTGKTYKLKNEFFDKFTDKGSSETEEEFFNTIIEKYTWWQIIGAVLLDLNNGSLNDIYNHKVILAKKEQVDNKDPNATIRGLLQSHTIDGCEFVKLEKRTYPQFIYKDIDSKWSVNEDEAKKEAPEIYELFNKMKSFKPHHTVTKKRYVFTTFHQSFSYEDFIEGIKPIVYEDEQNPERGKQVIYDIKPGLFKKIVKEANEDRNNDYAIFIDEINRGNIANIFGELITLIEDDKRIDTANYIPAKLPYSNEDFGVPLNLFIIGTMNTADRSVEALDTALRRRFSFIEMNPEPAKLSTEEFKCTGIDLEALLNAINARIEKLLDKDYCIGHSYFMTIINRQSPLEEIKTIFQNKILPLLQEYFYGDWGKILLVIGQEFVETKKNTIKFLSTESYEDFEEYDEKPIYNFTKPSSWTLYSFKSIYE